MSIENGEGSSLGPPMSSDEDVDAEMMGGASSSVGNGSASGIGVMEDSDLSDDDDDVPQVDRYGFMGGKQFTDEDPGVPIAILRKREMKWLDMIDDWEKWMTKKPKKVRERCRKGIPSSIRSRAWQYLCGSRKMLEQNKDRFKEVDEMEGDPKWLDIIEKDLDRQFPFHEMFAKKGGNGQQDLYRILKAYSIYNPRDGYCQGMAPVAAVLLMHMPAEEAFWCLVQICERYLTGYYSPGLEAVQIDGEVLFGLMKKVLHPTYKHMKKHRIEPILYMTEWYMCIFARTLPWSSVLRVWDMFFFEGVKIMFRVALVLLKNTLGTTQQLADSPGLYETMEKLKHIPDSVVQEEFLVSEMLKMRVFEKELEGEHALSQARRKATRQRQLSSEKAAANARDIEVKKKSSKANPAKEWMKEKKRKDKERLRQNDTDSVMSVPYSEGDPEGSIAAGQIGNGTRASEKDDKKKKKKQKNREKLTIDIATATDSKWNNYELNSPDIEKEYEIVDRISMSSGSPTKAWRSKQEAYTDRDNMSEDALDTNSSKKKKKSKDKKKKSKNKEKDAAPGDDDDAISVMTVQGSVIDGSEMKDDKKGKKKKSKNKKGHSEEDDAVSVVTLQDSVINGDGKGSKKKDKKKKKKGKELEVDENNLPGMVMSSGSDKAGQDDSEWKQSFSTKDKKKDKKGKDSNKDSEVSKGNGVIPHESTPSDGSISSPPNLSDFEVVERHRPPSDGSKLRGSEKRMGLIYTEEEIQSQWKEFGPIPEIPSFEEVRQRRISKEREHEERRQRLADRSKSEAESESANEQKGEVRTVSQPEAEMRSLGPAESETRTKAPMLHSLSNGMEPANGLSSQQVVINGNSDAPVSPKSKLHHQRDYRSFDYGTTV